MGERFDPNTYWQSRVGADATIGVVGHRSLGAAYNEYIYRRRLDVLNHVLAQQKVTPDRDAILDVGCGSGFYSRFWHSRGFRKYTGIDLSKAVINRLTIDIPEYTFLEADISEPLGEAIAREPFSVITALDVFYHIVDDTALSTALNNIRERLAPNGILIVFDHLTKVDYALHKHVKFRSESRYSDMLRQSGLEIVYRQKLFCFLVPPLFGRQAVDVPIGALYKAIGICMTALPILGRLLGWSMYELDRVLRRIGVDVPNNEVLLIRESSAKASNRDG